MADQGTPGPDPCARTITNPISGERIVIRVSGAETGGRLLRFDLFLPSGGHVPAGHVHPSQQERFTVLAGRMRFRLGRRTLVVGPGETVEIPSGAAHWFGNPGPGISHAVVDVRPALRTEELFVRTEQLSGRGRLLGTRLPRLSDLACVILDFQEEITAPHLPARLVRFGLGPLAWAGRRRARRSRA
ncbi:MAG TPA: cupin domain-containing protein [Verrucomicrobiae bacterium]|nr:cupin domain-containing protein [Verrucomicrobiae bacterium]